MAVASERLFVGSKGMNAVTLGSGRCGGVASAAARIAASTGSFPSVELASAAKASTSPGVHPSANGRTVATANSFLVRVPVLSAHSTSIVAASCNAASRVNSTPLSATVLAPKAAASVKVAGNATGTAESSAVSTSEMICARR